MGLLRRHRAAACLAALAILVTGTSCDPAVAGRRCSGGLARDDGWVLVCRNGRWQRSITIAEAGRIVAERIAAATTSTNPPPPAQPAGDPVPMPTTTTAPPATTSTTTSTTSTTTTTQPPGPTTTVLAVGDIAICGGEHPKVAALLHARSGPFLALGDQNQGDDPATEYPNCYDPYFGVEKDRTYPVPGNHEYAAGSPPAAYLSYFGDRATPNGTRWYSYDLGNWHVVALDSNCTEPAMSCGTSSAQYRWLAADLAASTAPCLLAYWHHAPFDSQPGYNGQPTMVPMMQLLQREGLDVQLSGHVHNYERFARMSASGVPDPTGFRSFVVGTGGASHHAHGAARSGSEVRNDSTYGLLQLELGATGYSWQFVPVAGRTFTDSGSDTC